MRVRPIRITERTIQQIELLQHSLSTLQSQYVWRHLVSPLILPLTTSFHSVFFFLAVIVVIVIILVILVMWNQSLEAILAQFGLRSKLFEQ